MTERHLVFFFGLSLMFVMCVHSWTFLGGDGGRRNITAQLLDMSTFTANHFEFIAILTVQYKNDLEASQILSSFECTFVLTVVVMTTVAYISRCV
jgi:hypothetical protein